MEGSWVVRTEKLRKYFPVRAGGVASLFSREKRFVQAVDAIDLEIGRHEIVGLVGESGSGKTTLGRLLARLLEPTAGRIFLYSEDVTSLKKGQLKSFRRKVQIIFQNPFESLPPGINVSSIVAEPLKLIGTDERVIREKVPEYLEAVRLRPSENYLERYPHELSGGERQRVAIARALILKPFFLVADEPVSMLDASIRVDILNLLLSLRDEFKFASLFITHDFASVRYMSDRIAVMYLGRIVELGSTEDVIEEPLHPYSRALVSVIPVPDPRAKSEKTILKGEIPEPINPPSGCRFHPRCPEASDLCKKEEPEFIEIKPHHYVSCHLYTHK